MSKVLELNKSYQIGLVESKFDELPVDSEECTCTSGFCKLLKKEKTIQPLKIKKVKVKVFG